MLEIEITEIPPLTPAQQSIANCHSLLNVYNVLREELAQMGRDLAGEPGLLATTLANCERRISRLGDHAAAMHDAMHTDEVEVLCQQEIDLYLQRTAQTAPNAATAATRTQLDILFWILSVRARELVARMADPTRVVQFSLGDLELDLQEFFRAVEQHSRGRYRFVQNLAVQTATDYYVDLRLESTRSSGIAMPTLIRDVLRDLIANARKYTAPGGQLRVALHAGPAGLRCVVEDNGRGIPPGELAEVVHFGRRGSNVADVRAYGASCGLTKAFLATRALGGQFWIASELGHGTRIRLWLPPQDAGAPQMRAMQE